MQRSLKLLSEVAGRDDKYKVVYSICSVIPAFTMCTCRRGGEAALRVHTRARPSVSRARKFNDAPL